ncbi:GGDEF domain-containing protein [Marinomonas sp.]
MLDIKIKNILRKLLGDQNSPTQYTHHAALITCSGGYLFSSWFNYFYHASDIGNVYFQLALGLFLAWIWFRSRFHNQFDTMAIVFMMLMPILSVPVNWFFNAGSCGPTYLLGLAALIYITANFRQFGIYQKIAQGLCILIPLPLMIIERQNPDWIFNYPNLETQQIDLIVSFFLVSLVMLLLISANTMHFRLEQQKVEALSVRLRLLSEQDSLTGLSNRHILEREYSAWQNNTDQLCLAIIDLDWFKQVNDNYGHAYGDHVLRKLAELLQESAVNSNGLAVRLGGEEFVLLMPISKMEAFTNLNVLADKLRNTSFEHGTITFSAGLIEVNTLDNQIESLKKADTLLYEAKNSGRDRIAMDYECS